MESLAFYLVAIPAVLIFGVSKGGFGGGLGIVAVPLMSLVVSPAKAAGVLLPVLVLMDLIGLAAYRGRWDRQIVKAMLPGAVLGIALASFAFGYLPERAVRLLLGLIAIGFTLNYFLRPAARAVRREHRVGPAALWGGVAGFTSTLAHSGGPPANFYLLPLKRDKTIFVGTMVVLFAAINALKLMPYLWLGLFDRTNLVDSLVLSPVAALGIGLGVWLHKRVDEALFYRLCYLFVLLTGLKLLWDGLV